MDAVIDNHFISELERKLEKTQMKRVDADVLDKLIEKEESHEFRLSEEQRKQLLETFESAIADPQMKVEVSALPEDAAPVTITMEEWMRRMKDMSKLGGGMAFYGTLPDSYKVTVNANHKFADRLLTATGDEQKDLAKHAFDLARLSLGLLKGADLTAFVERSVARI
ncbi:MAG: hypothetical protein NVV59_06090 [Chitinophagaceae bacterium]|nr:hypothetical protein [Chitinophagaceae bacterium]